MLEMLVGQVVAAVVVTKVGFWEGSLASLLDELDLRCMIKREDKKNRKVLGKIKLPTSEVGRFPQLFTGYSTALGL